jgi:hypothetical protein
VLSSEVIEDTLLIPAPESAAVMSGRAGTGLLAKALSSVGVASEAASAVVQSAAVRRG